MQRPIGWYIRRIRTMRPHELVHRVQEHMAVRRLKSMYRQGLSFQTQTPAYSHMSFCVSEHAKLPGLEWNTPSSDECKNILAGRWHALGYPWRWQNRKQDWHTAPDTQRRWPKQFFGQIPYLDGNPYGDVRVAWEPSRLQQLIALALIANHSGYQKHSAHAIELIEAQLISWVEANPDLEGIHFISVMECAQRIMAACHALDLVRSRLTRPEQTWKALLYLVHGHAKLIATRMSLHSSTGNHTVTEAAGLIYAGMLFPELPDAAQWLKMGAAILSDEANGQVLPDGGGIEQAFRYQLLVIDLMGLVTRLFQHYDQTPPPPIANAYARGCQFLGQFAHRYEDLPTIGDSDSGFAISRYLRLSWKNINTDVGTTTFPHAGYTLIKSDHLPSSLRLIFDHGPFGMPPLYGHGHADALSVNLTLGQQNILIDPGTYSYTGHPVWRRYFRSTRAHNTVTVDDQDQATQELSFMWSNAHDAHLVEQMNFDNLGTLILANHGGYQRLGIMHWRGLVFDGKNSLVIVDWLLTENSQMHELELNWHSAVEPMQTVDGIKLRAANSTLGITIQGGEISIKSQQDHPIHGWMAPVYGERIAAHTISSRITTNTSHQFVTQVNFTEPVEAHTSTTDQLIARLNEVAQKHGVDL